MRSHSTHPCTLCSGVLSGGMLPSVMGTCGCGSHCVIAPKEGAGTSYIGISPVSYNSDPWPVRWNNDSLGAVIYLEPTKATSVQVVQVQMLRSLQEGQWRRGQIFMNALGARGRGYHTVFQRTQRQPYIHLGATRVIGLGRIMLVFSNGIRRNQRFNSNAWRNGALYVSIGRY